MNAHSSTNGMLRTFVAAVPPQDVLDRLETYIERLRLLAPYKWVPRQQLHLTLRFLGDEPRALVERLSERLKSVDFESFEIGLDRVGGFPVLGRPRALWLGGDKAAAGMKKLAEFAAEIESCVRDAGFPAEKRVFSAHLTIARLREPESLPLVVAQALYTVPVVSWRCDRFFLIRSELTPTGPVYSPLAEYRLR